MQSHSPAPRFAFFLTGLLLLLACAPARAQFRAYGEAATVDNPVLRIPYTQEAPTIDGVMEAGEWEDASALSGFWYDFAQAHFVYLAPPQTQLQVYTSYDDERLYVAYTSPVYPVDSWLRARGRFPNVTHHPEYGLIWDDHLELELRPYADNAEGFRKGLFKWFVNPTATVADLYWSIQGGEKKRWSSKIKARSEVTSDRWVVEMAIPLESFRQGQYEGREDGQPIVQLPPPDGTTYRAWFVRGIGGNNKFFNVFANHSWNTTQTKLIFDRSAPSFQVNELGPIMEDMVDVEMSVKNHADRSKTVRVGFFVESAEGAVYSSFDAPELTDGLLELVPGEHRKIRLQAAFPGITTEGNTLWFDVRSAGEPAKILFRTPLIDFHSMEGGEVDGVSFRERRIDTIEDLRPPRRDFRFRHNVSPYHSRVGAVADIGGHGASAEARSAKEAMLMVMTHDAREEVIAETTAEFRGNFATFLLDAPFEDGVAYKLTLLLFDENRRIVGERTTDPFEYREEPWHNNEMGKNDVVWEPFTPIAPEGSGFQTLKHRFEVAETSLPAQIGIKADPADLPLEVRGGEGAAALSEAELLELGRGPQLRGPVRLGVVVDGETLMAEPVSAAEVSRAWQSEREYTAKLAAGPIEIDLVTEYDADGAMHVTMQWGSGEPVEVEDFFLEMPVAGRVDMAVSAAHGGGMAGADIWDAGLPEEAGVIWDSADVERPELYYSCFMPWFFFGSGDRGFTWFADSDRGWILDRDGSSIRLIRDEAGDVTMRVQFVNHEAVVEGEREIAFSMLTHPSKPKPEGHRLKAWHYLGTWADEYIGGDLFKPREDLIAKAKHMTERLSGLEDPSEEELAEWTPEGPQYHRFYQLRNFGLPPVHIRQQITERGGGPEDWPKWMGGTPLMDRHFEDKFVYRFEEHIRVGRRHGWWWDETWPTSRSNNFAEGDAYLRDPEAVGEDELPWQEAFLTTYQRRMFKRLARVFADLEMPQRNNLWANTAATTFESFAWDTMLVEEAGGEHRTFEVDIVTQYPSALWRFETANHTGLIARMVAGKAQANSGDDKRLDRQVLGRVLLHDIGLVYKGPHGILAHREQGLRVLEALEAFGYFEPEGVERIPYWRSEPFVRLTGDPELTENVHITVYRRPLEDGSGYKALMVVMNENREAIEMPLVIGNAKRIVGGANTLTAGQVRAGVEVPEALAGWWQTLAGRRAAGAPALRDVEFGDAVTALEGDPATYGPVHVRPHNYRLFYLEHRE